MPEQRTGRHVPHASRYTLCTHVAIVSSAGSAGQLRDSTASRSPAAVKAPLARFLCPELRQRWPWVPLPSPRSPPRHRLVAAPALPRRPEDVHLPARIHPLPKPQTLFPTYSPRGRTSAVSPSISTWAIDLRQTRPASTSCSCIAAAVLHRQSLRHVAPHPSPPCCPQPLSSCIPGPPILVIGGVGLPLEHHKQGSASTRPPTWQACRVRT